MYIYIYIYTDINASFDYFFGGVSSFVGRPWQALMMFDLMPFLRLVPNAITYGSALSACDSASQWQQALSLWLEAKEAEIWWGIRDT